ncbi:MAG: beta-galactosidase [Oscillospiraceae bacterium]
MIKIGIDYYPEHWDRSLWEADLAAMAALGVHTVRIAEFAWSRMEPEEGKFDFSWLDEAIALIARHGMQVILGTPTNCAPLWLYTNYPDTVQWERNGQPTSLGIRGHRCMVSPTFRRYAGRIVEELAKRYAGKPEIFAWQLDNELESNHCTCPACTQSFRSFLKEKYGSLEALNQAWGTDVWSGQVSAWEQITPLLGPNCSTNWYNPAGLLDYERFAAACTTDYVRFQSEIIRKYDPKAVITTNSCFCANLPDFHQEFAQLDVAAYDNYPKIVLPEDPETLYSNAFALDFIRSFKQKNFWILEQLGGPMGCWGPISPAMEPGMLEGYALQAVAHGADLLSFFRWRTSVSGAEMFCHGILDHSNVPNRRLAELEGLCRRLEKHPQLSETTPHSRAAMLYSADQEFSLKNQIQSEGFAYWTQLRLFHEASMNLGVNLDILPEGHSLEGYRVVLVPTHFITDEGVVAQLEDFAARGGTVVITNRSGVKDKHGNCILGQSLPGPLRRLCGCCVTEYDAIGPAKQRIRSTYGGSFQITGWCDLLKLETAKSWAKYADRYYSGVSAISWNQYGKGKVYYVGTIGEKAMYRALLLEIYREQGIELLELLPLGVESTVRSGPGGTYRFFFNNTNDGKSFHMGEEKVALLPFEMKIRTQTGEWI